jgi:hypothetical protein
MFDYIIAFIIPIVAIAIVFAWVPFLNFICPPCARSLETRGLSRGGIEKTSVRLETNRHVLNR